MYIYIYIYTYIYIYIYIYIHVCITMMYVFKKCQLSMCHERIFKRKT